MGSTRQRIAEPERALQELVDNELGVLVRPRDLRKFVVMHWAEITRLAHAIHEDAEHARQIDPGRDMPEPA